MNESITHLKIPIEQLRWRLDPQTLSFETTQDLEPLKEIVGQKRGVAAFCFGIQMKKSGYNVIVTGQAGSGRKATVKRMLEELVQKDGVPDDLCYVNNFKNQEYPILIRLKAGQGATFKSDVRHFINMVKKEIPALFESEEYINAKKEIGETSERKAKSFFKDLDKKVKDEGFALVDVQVGQVKKPELMPLVDEKPIHIDQVEDMAAKGRFPNDQYLKLREKHDELKEQINNIFRELRELQKEIQANVEEMDRTAFTKTATSIEAPFVDKYDTPKVHAFFKVILEDMADNLSMFQPQPQAQVMGVMPMVPESDRFQAFEVNLLVDNSQQEGPPVIIEEYPMYKNIFGSVDRIVDRNGVWRTDFSKIKAGSLIRANGGYLVFYLNDAMVEPGVWHALKRALKSKKLEFHTYDPFNLFAASGLKPDPIELDVKVVMIANPYLFHMLQHYDEDARKIFKVRADFDTTMDKTDDNIRRFAEFIKTTTDEEDLRPFDRTAVATLVEEAVRMTGRQEKLSSSFPAIKERILDADYWAEQESKPVVDAASVDQALAAKIYRSNLMEEHLQDMIDRGTLMIDVVGDQIGQVNGLAVYSLGDFAFGKPSRITASTSMGRAGLINIERESDMSGNTHNKGILILSGYLRKIYAQDKPLTMSASIAFEQSYSGVDGDSASSTEIYALLSSLSGLPIKQSIAVTGSVNQNGEVQAIGGVNHKIEGFYDCCRKVNFTETQGVMIPKSNVKDLMLRKDVVQAVEDGKFHIYAVETINEGIEILTGTPAGKKTGDGSYPDGTINQLVDQKLRGLAEGLKNFGREEDKEENDKGDKE